MHSALAAIDLERGTDSAGRPPSEVARARATAQGIGDHGDTVAAMVHAALGSPSVRAGAGRRHWRELYVAIPVGGHDAGPDHEIDAAAADGVLEGFIDLVVEEGDGLVVVDYKTDHAPDEAARRRAAARYGPQVAAYAARPRGGHGPQRAPWRARVRGRGRGGGGGAGGGGARRGTRRGPHPGGATGGGGPLKGSPAGAPGVGLR